MIVFEDEHLLVVRKPPGINTHAASAFAGEGIYEWLRRREPRWADLAILQRLDKETSGLLLFSKSRRANVSLSKQFGRRRVAKEYLLLTDRRPPSDVMVARSWIRKGRGRFESGPAENDGLEAETRFEVLSSQHNRWTIRAEPLTGRTHQIRLHAADQGFPIMGDVTYGGTPFPRLCLHARGLRLRHPATNADLEFSDEPRFEEPAAAALRQAIIDTTSTTAYRMIHGASDGHPGWYVDRLGNHLLAQATGDDPEALPEWIVSLAIKGGFRGVYLRRTDRSIRGAAPVESSPRLLWGDPSESGFEVLESGLKFRLSLNEGYSTGLFLDQRENRRRLLMNWVGPRFPVRESSLMGAEMLNLFAYTCGFSVAAAAAGAVTTNIDLSRKYLDWGRENFGANNLHPGSHQFLFGDAFEWLRRLARKERRFEIVVVDPPTFSQSRESGVFRAESNYKDLIGAVAKVLAPGAVMLASTNAARFEAARFIEAVESGLLSMGRRLVDQLFVPQPPDFPTSREEPGYLKTLWVRVAED